HSGQCLQSLSAGAPRSFPNLQSIAIPGITNRQSTMAILATQEIHHQRDGGFLDRLEKIQK
ncbi:MAG: hypothetical protein ACKN81_05575, partial [Pirellulaceae bacterium]